MSAHPEPVLELPDSFAGFVTGLQDPVRPLSMSPAKFAAYLRIPMQDIAAAAKVHRNTVRMYPDAPALQNYMRDVTRVLQAATDLQGNLPKAAYWFFNHPIRDLEHKTAAELVRGRKTDAVLGYLEMLEAGATG